MWENEYHGRAQESPDLVRMLGCLAGRRRAWRLDQEQGIGPAQEFGLKDLIGLSHKNRDLTLGLAVGPYGDVGLSHLSEICL